MSDVFEFKDAVLTVHLPQDLDHLQSDRIRKETDRIMGRTYVKKIIFDFKNTEFMDSSGVGLIMGRYRALGMGQKCIMAANVDGRIDKLLHLSGVHRYMEIRKNGEEGGNYGKCK
ncbi:MAG: anti-sigma factor antagonist [Eubacteriales bacterium]|nr:anti-sigma factor antagonist [Eubacteriales bacterium]